MHKVFIMEALECLRRIEKESIQTIYIDPPYNTKSSNFEYEDAHADYEKWIKEHLILAKAVLKQSGCIFISIDDNKMAEVKIIANEVFGTRNFLGTFITKQATRSNAKHINITHEYVLSYAKNKAFAPGFKILRTLLPIYTKPLKDLMRTIKNGIFKLNLIYKIITLLLYQKSTKLILKNVLFSIKAHILFSIFPLSFLFFESTNNYMI